MKQIVARIVSLGMIMVTVFLIATSLMCENVKAENAAGTWTGPCTDQTGAADFHYHAILTLTGESSVSGTLKLTCTSVDINIAGSESARNQVGSSVTFPVDGTISGSILTLYVHDSTGTYTFSMTVSGGAMTGGGQYRGAASEMNTWTFNLVGGGGMLPGVIPGLPDMSFLTVLTVPTTVIAVTGAACSLATSFLPAPRGMRGMRGIKGRPRTQPSSSTHQQTPARHIPVPYQAHPQSHPAQKPQPKPDPSGPPPPPPLLNPAQTVTMPTPRDLGPTTGNSLVPWDAPLQCAPTTDPPDYPYPKGTNASMRCPYCGFTTLSPFTIGWFCTNSQCPARRELLQKGYTTNQFNNMTWRGL